MKALTVLFACALVALPISDSVAQDASASEESLSAFFPDGLQDIEGNKVSVDSLDGKLVGLYFSAHWCPPCRKFTPTLVEYRNANKEDFEVVFLSSDRTEDAKKKYMEEADMEFLTVDYDSDVKEKLSAKWGVRGIPMLVLLRDGKTLTTDGRAYVTQGTDVAALKNATIETEEFDCGQCDKTHTRDKLVLAK